MNYDPQAFALHSIRGSDTNSLLRLHDLASEISAKSPLQYDRARAEKAMQRIAKELKKRDLPAESRR